MRIGMVATRLFGVDGVTFEAAKWEAVLERRRIRHWFARPGAALAALPLARLPRSSRGDPLSRPQTLASGG